MSLTRQEVRDVLIRMDRAGHLASDGPISFFLPPEKNALLPARRQLSVQVTDAEVIVRASRLPFARPMRFTLAELREAQP